LRIPAAMGKESMQKHMLISIPIGLIVGLAMTLISSTIAYFRWFN
jgi:sensor c-di-GMP phosphodiesterase-like protein